WNALDSASGRLQDVSSLQCGHGWAPVENPPSILAIVGAGKQVASGGICGKSDFPDPRNTPVPQRLDKPAGDVHIVAIRGLASRGTAVITPVVLIPGDGIGPEVTASMGEVLRAAGARVSWVEASAGLDAVERFGDPLPAATLDLVRRYLVSLTVSCT